MASPAPGTRYRLSLPISVTNTVLSWRVGADRSEDVRHAVAPRQGRRGDGWTKRIEEGVASWFTGNRGPRTEVVGWQRWVVHVELMYPVDVVDVGQDPQLPAEKGRVGGRSVDPDRG